LRCQLIIIFLFKTELVIYGSVRFVIEIGVNTTVEEVGSVEMRITINHGVSINISEHFRLTIAIVGILVIVVNLPSNIAPVFDSMFLQRHGEVEFERSDECLDIMVTC